MKAFSEADTPALKELTAAIASAKDELNSEMRANLYKNAIGGTGELLARAAWPFDRTEPTLPMARHAAELVVSREQLAAQLDKNHIDLISRSRSCPRR